MEPQLRLLAVGVKSSPDGVVICSAPGAIEYANAMAARLLETDAEHMIGRQLSETSWLRVVPISRLLRAASTQTAPPSDETVQAVLIDGSVRSVRIRVSTSVEQPALTRHLVVTLEDVSESLEMRRRRHCGECL